MLKQTSVTISNTFETIYPTDPPREKEYIREIGTIELSDHDWGAKLVYRHPAKIDDNSSEYLKAKYDLAQKICKESFVVDTLMEEKPIKEVKTNAKGKSKIPKKVSKKANPKSHKEPVEKI